MRIIDDTGKKLTPATRNWFYAVTVLIALANILMFAVYGSDVPGISHRPGWGTFSVNNLLQALINTFSHANRQHVLLNMLCFVIAGSYLERKMGSLRFLLFMILLCFFMGLAVSANNIGFNWHGFSGANYGLYGYILLDYLFTLARRRTRTLFNIVYGAVIIALIYFAMCFSGGVSHIGFEWYPYDLLHNLGHASGFAVGLLLGLCLPLSAILIEKETA